MADVWERDFAAYVDGRGGALRSTAYLLCGDWHAAEDLTQATLTKLYLAWRRIDRAGSVDAYARRVLLRAFLDERRRPWRRERPAAYPPDRPAAADGPGAVDERLALAAALRTLPRTQRAAVVLRYWCDLDIKDTAATLGVSEGTVKREPPPGGWRHCIYGPGVTIVCAVGGRVPYNPWGDAGFYASTAWLSGPVSIDYHESQADDPAADGRPAIPAWDRVAGRVAPGVVRVTARLGPDSVTVPVVNGTYLADIVRGLHDWAIIPGERKLTVTAYDAAGRALDPTTCAVDSRGKSYNPPPGKRCPKPVRWP